MKVLITGAAGYLGRGLIEALEPHHSLRLLDVVEPDSPHDTLVGDVSDYAAAERAVHGVDAMVLAHMAPRREGVYDNPQRPFEVNVVGTANLYAAAASHGVRRVALISTLGVVAAHARRDEFLRRDTPPEGTDPYVLSKICQERIAEQYYRVHGIGSALLRPSYVQDADTLADKYGRVISAVNWHIIDRRDIGQAARLAVELDDLACEVFYVLGHPSADRHADVAYTRDRLGWRPEHTFSHLPCAE